MIRVLMLYFVIHFFGGHAQNYCALVTFTSNVHAYIDENCKILYLENKDPLIKEKIFAYKNGLGRIRQSGKFGFINHKGEVVIPTIYDKLEDFNEGLAEVEINGKWGYLNAKGEIEITPQFQTVHRFSCGLAAFGKNGKHGYIDKKGKIVITPIFDRVCHFHDNKAWVLLDGKWGCINKKGEFLIEPTYSDTYDFSEGYAWVKKNLLWGLVDSTNKYIIAPNERNNLIYAYSAIQKNFAYVTNGTIISKSYNKTGYCSLPTLQKSFTETFDAAQSFEDSLAIITVNKKCGVIDIHGQIIVEPKYQEIKYIGRNDVFAVKEKSNTWGLLHLATHEIIFPIFKNIYNLEKIQ